MNELKQVKEFFIEMIQDLEGENSNVVTYEKDYLIEEFKRQLNLLGRINDK